MVKTICPLKRFATLSLNGRINLFNNNHFYSIHQYNYKKGGVTMSNKETVTQIIEILKQNQFTVSEAEKIIYAVLKKISCTKINSDSLK